MENTRQLAYETKKKELSQICENCRKTQSPSTERCEYHCSNGRRLRWLEAEYSDVTGWNHKRWKDWK